MDRPCPEADFNHDLHTKPREALGPFLNHKGGEVLEYLGACQECKGTGEIFVDYGYGVTVDTCPACEGGLGPPHPHLLEMAADWWDGVDEMKARVCREYRLEISSFGWPWNPLATHGMGPFPKRPAK